MIIIPRRIVGGLQLKTTGGVYLGSNVFWVYIQKQSKEWTRYISSIVYSCSVIMPFLLRHFGITAFVKGI